MRKSTITVAAIGVLAIAAAATLRFGVVPGLDEVPANLDLTGHYAGTASLLNSAALASGDTAHVFLTNVPVTATQHVRVTATDGSTAVMSSDITVSGADGSKLLAANHIYAVDRVTLEPAAAPAGSNAENHTGLAVGFPLTPKETTYQFWDSTSDTAAPATYTKTTTTNGRQTYVYAVHSAGPVKDPTTLAGLPAQLPKTALAALAPGLPAAQATQLTAALPVLPDSIPLTYASVTDVTATVDVATGWLLALTQQQTITASMNLPTGATPLAPVLSMTLTSTPASIADSVKDATDAANLLTLAGATIPAALAVFGLILVVLAIWLARRRRGTDADAPTPNVADAPVAA
jgi:hypothetical protein